MIIYKEAAALAIKLEHLKKEDCTIGFIPTMGALHPGHLSVLNQSIEAGNITIFSIFVNPTQFNDQKDFEKYPITIENDIYLLEKTGTNILFLPSVDEMYPEGLQPTAAYNLGSMETMLEGFYRPGHFQGVCRIVHKLLNIVQPHHLYMGQKDYQQCMVVRKLINDFNIPTLLNIVPTQREETGLAMSSRNTRLSQPARQQASAIYRAHVLVKNNLLKLSLNELKALANDTIMSAGFEKIDYIEICDAISLQPAVHYSEDQKLVILSAAFIESVRLIDNLQLN
ncbi:pantoate--beta-alanine ligase [soil metagenome]